MKRIEDTTVNITVNNVKISAEKGESVLEAAKRAGPIGSSLLRKYG